MRLRSFDGHSIDRRFLCAQRHRLAVTPCHLDAREANFLLEDQPSLDDQNLLHDGDHRGVAFLAVRWRDIDHPADGHPFDLDALVGELFVDQTVLAGRADLKPDAPSLHTMPLDRDLFGMKLESKQVVFRRLRQQWLAHNPRTRKASGL